MTTRKFYRFTEKGIQDGCTVQQYIDAANVINQHHFNDDFELAVMDWYEWCRPIGIIVSASEGQHGLVVDYDIQKGRLEFVK